MPPPGVARRCQSGHHMADGPTRARPEIRHRLAATGRELRQAGTGRRQHDDDMEVPPHRRKACDGLAAWTCRVFAFGFICEPVGSLVLRSLYLHQLEIHRRAVRRTLAPRPTRRAQDAVRTGRITGKSAERCQLPTGGSECLSGRATRPRDLKRDQHRPPERGTRRRLDTGVQLDASSSARPARVARLFEPITKSGSTKTAAVRTRAGAPKLRPLRSGALAARGGRVRHSASRCRDVRPARDRVSSAPAGHPVRPSGSPRALRPPGCRYCVWRAFPRNRTELQGAPALLS